MRFSDRAKTRLSRKQPIAKSGSTPSARLILAQPHLQHALPRAVAVQGGDRVRILNRIRAWWKTTAIGQKLGAKLMPRDIAALASTAVKKMAARDGTAGDGKLGFAKSDAQLDAEYDRMAGTDGGRRLDVDMVRELSPEYRADRSRAQDIHDAASGYTQRRYLRMLDAPVSEGRDKSVEFLAGGGGSGKSTIAEHVFGKSGADIVYDGTFSDLAKSRENIKAALESGRDAHVIFVYRSPEKSAAGAIGRAIEKGRPVPIEALAKAHANAPEVVRALAQEYNGNPRVQIIAIHNDGQKSDAHLMPIEDIPHVEQGSAEAAFQSELDRAKQEGRINDRLYAAFVRKRGLEQPAEVGEAGSRKSQSGPHQERRDAVIDGSGNASGALGERAYARSIERGGPSQPAEVGARGSGQAQSERESRHGNAIGDTADSRSSDIAYSRAPQDRAGVERRGASGPGAEPSTGIKNAQVAAERAERGLDELHVAGKRDYGQVWDKAAATLKAGARVMAFHLQLGEPLAFAVEEILGHAQAAHPAVRLEQGAERRFGHVARQAAHGNRQHRCLLARFKKKRRAERIRPALVQR